NRPSAVSHQQSACGGRLPTDCRPPLADHRKQYIRFSVAARAKMAGSLTPRPRYNGQTAERWSVAGIPNRPGGRSVYKRRSPPPSGAATKSAALGRFLHSVLAAALIVGLPVCAAASDANELAQKAQAVLKANCHRCHGQDGAVEGGMNYILDRDKLVAWKKIVPGRAEQSPLFLRVAAGKMPPPDEQPRPTAADVEILKQWIDAGVGGATQTTVQRKPISDAAVFALILADLESREKRSRRFTRYFSLAHLYNAGLGDDELQTYRNALAKLINSLSWH